MIGILSDIHGNLHALEAVLADMPEVSEIWVLGDMVGGLAFPCEVMERLLNLPVPVSAVLGNWEERMLEARSGLHPEHFKSSKFGSSAWTMEQLKPHHWSYLDGLGNTLALEGYPGGALLYHGRPGDAYTGIYSKEDAQSVAKSPEGSGKKLLVGGHTHKCRLFRLDNQIVVGVGSIGFSFDGIEGAACYALLENDGIVFRHVSYDAEKAVNAIKSSGLYERAPGFSRAIALSASKGRNHVMSLLNFCEKYGGPFEEAELAWDGSEWEQERTR